MITLCLFIFVSFASQANVDCDHSSCLKCPENPAICTQCQNGYLLQNGLCSYKTVEHCTNADGYWCQTCEDGYKFKADQNTCVEGEDGCGFQSHEGHCITCKKSYGLVDSHCVKCPTDANCETFNSACECTRCDSSHFLNVSKYCISLDPYCSNYGAASDNHATCEKCLAGYYLHSETKTCKKGNLANCMIYDVKNGAVVCSTCLFGYVVSNGVCTNLTEVFGPDCLNSWRGDVCERCKEKTYADNMTCIRCIENCKACTDEYCDVCENGFGYDGTLKVCTACSIGCGSCSYISNVETCQACLPEYVKKGEGCIRSELPAYTCDTTATDETTCTGSGNSCVYEVTTLKHPLCVYKSSNCSEWDTSNLCTRCLIGYKVSPSNPSVCVPIDNKCLTYKETTDGKTVKCAQCTKGYFITDDFLCKRCDDVCADGECSYAMDNCASFLCADPNCQKCATRTSKCEKCLFGEVKEDGSCEHKICVNEISEGKCSVCAEYGNTTKIVNPETNPTLVPNTLRFYLPGENLTCLWETEEDKESDLLWLWIFLGVLAGLLIIIGISGIVTGVILYNRKKASKYQDLDNNTEKK
ncbi:hypothetical protein EIN_523980 [Entamoeba invadens IP1]|uniref:Furin repeat-containing protein n=1 Tax=Entamoeba invadens IP1 TaxID=370355 RepID=A0A0A1UEY1_ENTIV|nr:hypothetical protein EIN_523980 [Entamoeba invadens IP1]ELP92490.1 hypothetical protein EIN_523980 [Entamoeba invadens IP1]|eukprot:XP_004259261.1 hypothetical protein EIN_523980 [Entamoeba invadens IP1]